MYELFNKKPEGYLTQNPKYETTPCPQMGVSDAVFYVDTKPKPRNAKPEIRNVKLRACQFP